MSFKDQIQADLAVFLNPEEFGEQHTIDDQQVIAVVDDFIQDQHSLAYTQGVFLSQLVVIVSKTELGYVPEQQQRMRFDGKYMTVVHVSDDGDLLTLRLEANDT